MKNTSFKIHHYTTLTSTMEEADRLYREEESTTGTVVVTDTQTRGRGRFARVWQCFPGNLYATLLWSFPQAYVGWGAMMMGFAIKNALAHLIQENSMPTTQHNSHGSPHAHVTLKWPNDVLVGGKKIAGILLDVLASKEQTPSNHFVIAIGFGVNIQDYPKDSEILATSLVNEHPAFSKTSPQNLRNILLQHILEEFQTLHAHFIKDGPHFLKDLFHEQTPRGTPLSVRTGEVFTSGTFLHLSPEGHLILLLPNGEGKTFASGDVIS